MLIKNKNKLALIFISKSNEENTDTLKENTTYVVDLMALVRVVMVILETFEDLHLSWVCTGCFANFIKAAEKAKRDSATKMIIKPPKLKVHRDFSNVFLNGENKTYIIELFFQTIKEKRSHILNALRTPQMIFSHKQKSVPLK